MRICKKNLQLLTCMIEMERLNSTTTRVLGLEEEQLLKIPAHMCLFVSISQKDDL